MQTAREIALGMVAAVMGWCGLCAGVMAVADLRAGARWLAAGEAAAAAVLLAAALLIVALLHAAEAAWQRGVR